MKYDVSEFLKEALKLPLEVRSAIAETLLDSEANMENKGRNDQIPTCKELYEMIRKQIEHEDSRVSQRINWLLTSQGFLFAAFTVIFACDKSNVSWDINISIIPGIIAGVGILFGGFSLMGIGAAHDSLNSLRSFWEKRFDETQKDQQLYKSFPQITWSSRGLKDATHYARGVPSLIIFIWFLFTFIIYTNPTVRLIIAILGILVTGGALFYIFSNYTEDAKHPTDDKKRK